MLALLALQAASAGPVDPGATALVAWRAQLGRADGDVRGEPDVLRWPGGWRVRVRPVVDGLTVDGGSQVVSLAPDGSVLRVSGRPVPVGPIPRGLVDRVAAVERAGQLASSVGSGAVAPPQVEEVARVTPAGLQHAWRISFTVADPLQSWVAWIDGSDGSVSGLAPTGHFARGNVFASNPVHGGPQTVELDHLDEGDVLRGPFADVWSCTDPDVGGDLFAFDTCTSFARQALPVDGDYLYGPNEGSLNDPFAEVNLHHHVSRAAAWFDARYGLRDPEPLRVIANFPLANAFYGDFDGDGRGDLSFGVVCAGCGSSSDPLRVQFAYDGDVVIHEFGHWVVGRIADVPMLRGDAYGLEWAGGSLNEGVADVFAMALTMDPQVGEYAGQAFGDAAIRDLDADRRCPDDLRGEVHLDGEIIGSVGWDLIQALGPERASDLLFGAVATWGPDIDWSIAGASLLDSADDLAAAGVLTADDHARARGIVEASGMPTCGRVIPLRDGDTPDPFIVSAGLVGPLERLPAGTQFSVDLGESPDRLVVDVIDRSAPDGLEWSLFVRCGEPVENEPTSLATFGLGFSVPTRWDWTVDGSGRNGRLAIDRSSVPPLPSEGTCFVEVTSRNAGDLVPLDFSTGRLTIAAHVERAVPETPEARGCSVTRTLPGAALMGFASLAVRRRRRAG